jgi:hypothetical protein
MLQPTFFDVTTGRGNKGRYTCCHQFITAVIQIRTLLNQNVLDAIEEIIYNNRPHCVAIECLVSCLQMHLVAIERTPYCTEIHFVAT